MGVTKNAKLSATFLPLELPPADGRLPKGISNEFFDKVIRQSIDVDSWKHGFSKNAMLWPLVYWSIFNHTRPAADVIAVSV